MKTRRAQSRLYRDARISDHTTTAVHSMSTLPGREMMLCRTAVVPRFSPSLHVLCAMLLYFGTTLYVEYLVNVLYALLVCAVCVVCVVCTPCEDMCDVCVACVYLLHAVYSLRALHVDVCVTCAL